jgi:hypothetical protein
MVPDLLAVAPSGAVSTYDRQMLALYAALLDAERGDADWQDVAASVMQLDPDEDDAEQCWRSHLERARWITGDGLAGAVEAFGTSRDQLRT